MSVSTSPTRWFRAKEAAAYAAVTIGTLRGAVEGGRLRAFVLTGSGAQRWRFRQADLDAWLTGSPVGAANQP